MPVFKSAMLPGAVALLAATVSSAAFAHPRAESRAETRIYRAAAPAPEAYVQTGPVVVAPTPVRRYGWLEIEALRAFERMR